MKKALIVASVASMIDQFNMRNIEILQELGYEVSVACNFLHGSSCSDSRVETLKKRLDGMGVKHFHIDFSRNIFNLPSLFRSYRELKRIIGDDKDIIHCHSPIGGMLCRLAARRARRKGTVVMYTAHGYHFYRGAPLLNWLVFYPVEKLCAGMTDVLITINGEDLELSRRKMRAGRIEYIPGVGVDTDRFLHTSVDREEKRASLGVPDGAFALVSVGELNRNKNQEVIIRAMAEAKNKELFYCVVGKGELLEYLSELAESLGVGERVRFLGFREDVNEIYKSCDACVFTSVREGLGISAVEAMASGLPLVVSDNRGTRCYATDGDNALVRAYDDVKGFADALDRLSSDGELAVSMGEKNARRAREFSSETVDALMRQIYTLEK